MSDTKSISFGFPERERLEFVFPPNHPHTEGWFYPAVSVSAGRFSVATELYCQLSDFAQLLPELESLYGTLRGTASLRTIEGQIGFTLTGDGLGHIDLKGFLKEKTDGRNCLNFSLAFDQTTLSDSIRQIKALLAAHPH